jgi:hypothetical protein
MHELPRWALRCPWIVELLHHVAFCDAHCKAHTLTNKYAQCDSKHCEAYCTAECSADNKADCKAHSRSDIHAVVRPYCETDHRSYGQAQ